MKSSLGIFITMHIFNSLAGSQLGSMTSLASSGGHTSQSGSMIDLPSYGEGRQAKKLIRRDHVTALQRISEIEGAIEQINHFIESTKYGPDHQRYALLKEKEKLILELQRFELYVKTEEERVCLFIRSLAEFNRHVLQGDGMCSSAVLKLHNVHFSKLSTVILSHS